MTTVIVLSAELSMIALALAVVVATVLGTRRFWFRRDWVIWCQVVLAGILAASTLARYLDPAPTTAEDLVRIFALRPGLVLVTLVLYLHAGRARRTSRKPASSTFTESQPTDERNTA